MASSSSLFTAPHPLVPLATFNVTDGSPAALEECGSAVQSELALMGGQGEMRTYSLFPSEEPPSGGSSNGGGQGAPDFLGRLHHLKTLFRMSATQDPVSVVIHRVGPLLILDDGPCGWSRGSSEHNQQPLPPLPGGTCSGPKPLEVESQLMLAALEPSLETQLAARPPAEALAGAAPGPPPGLQLPASELGRRLCVRNTFVDVMESDAEEAASGGAASAPARLGAATPETPLGSPRAGIEWDLPLTPVVQRLEQHAEQAANRWSLIPYQPEAGESGPIMPTAEPDSGSSILGSRHWDLLQMASPRKAMQSTRQALEAVRSLYSGIPPQPSRFGRSVEWRCGPFKILLGCDLVVLRSDDKCEFSDFASFKMLPPGSTSEPSREERIDVYLENLMCDITKAVWGLPDQGRTTWRVFKTADLPAASAPGEAEFDGKLLQEQGQRLLHFLRQKCHREGGTYWLFREQNSPAAELFDLSGSTNPVAEDSDAWKSSSRAFRTTPSLVLPIASLCLRLAKAMPNNADQRQLLEKGLHLLEPLKEEHAALYSMTALQLACSYMRTPLAAIPDARPPVTGSAAPAAEAPAAARLALALRYLEGIMGLLASLDDTAREEVALLAELRLQAHVAYTESIVKLVREACIPAYSAWLAEVQRQSQLAKQTTPDEVSQSSVKQMKQLSVAFLLWRLFWLCRAQRAFSFLPLEKRETECWTLDRDLCEITGDALYGLSRYPADDVHDLLGGQMASAEGICKVVEDALRNWGLRGSSSSNNGGNSAQQPVPRPKTNKGNKRLTSPVSSPRDASELGAEERQPHNVGAMFLSNLNPLTRGVGDDTLREDPLVRDDLRHALWTQGRAFWQCLALYERATARLRKTHDEEGAHQGTQRRQTPEDQATIKVARKLAHLYNEEARAALLQVGDSGTEEAEELLTQAHRWMMLSGDHSNASRVLLNLSELHARRAERLVSAGAAEGGGAPTPFTEAHYALWLRAIECCEEAATLSENALGRREGAFAHLRLGVHLSVRLPAQPQLVGGRRATLAELADRHFGKALRAFDELHDEREIAVCHFHMADLLLQEQRVPNAAPIPKTRLIAALRHARRSGEYWEHVGALQYSKDFIASHIRIARLLEFQQRSSATLEALEHLSNVEAHLVALANDSNCHRSRVQLSEQDKLFVMEKGHRQMLAVTAFRREMARICQSGLRQGEDVDRLKALYRRVLRNEPVATKLDI